MVQLMPLFTFSFSTYFSRSIIVRRCVLTASNKRILYCIVLSRGHSGNAFVVYLSTFIVKKVSSALSTILLLHFCMCLPTSNEVSKNLPTIIAVVVFQRILLVVRG